MKTYEVHICRSYVHEKYIKIKAFSAEQAKAIALQQIGYHVLKIRDIIEDSNFAKVVRELSR